jgi:hypothetical protein
MKIKNYTIYDKKISKNWNKLRNSEEHQSYFIPKNKKEFLERLESYKPTPRIISDFENMKNNFSLNKLVSFCSGSCMLEYYLMKKFNLYCEVSDNTDSIKRINKFKIFNKSSKIDITKNFKIYSTSTSIVLLSRIDTEFEDYQLNELFKKLYESKVDLIYFIPAELISLKTILVKLKIFFICLFKLRLPVSWGYVRSKKGFEKNWKRYYKTKSFHSKGAILKIK